MALLLLLDPAFAFWSGANESRFIASLAECKISRREEIGRIPSPAQGSVLSLPQPVALRGARAHPGAGCRDPTSVTLCPRSLGSKGLAGWGGVTGAITGNHLIFLPSPTLKTYFPLILWVSEPRSVACSGPSPNFQPKYICDQICLVSAPLSLFFCTRDIR